MFFSGIKVFLQVWNAVYIQRLTQDLKQSMEDDIRNAYSTCKDALSSLSQKRLDDIDLTSTQKTEAIKIVYRCFSTHESIGNTEASKALHMLNATLFMMWEQDTGSLQ